jgi:hypothetical protein
LEYLSKKVSSFTLGKFTVAIMPPKKVVRGVSVNFHVDIVYIHISIESFLWSESV